MAFRAVATLDSLRVIGVVIAVVVIDPRQGGTNQLAIGEILLVRMLLDGDGIHCFLHSGATPHALAQTDLVIGP